ncbi:MAG TPA: hypothetical protein VEJ22_00650 [Nitrospirota bacterium]|nr:hypothetical protein [Nitrospirota bacterium]
MISFSREMNLCKKTIQKIKKSLDILERKHGKSTDQFMKELESGILSADADLQDDYEAWKSSYASLQQWEELEKQYQEAYNMIKH